MFRMRFTITLIFARALSRRVQSMVTLVRTLVTSSVAITSKIGVAHDLHRTLVGGEGVVERYLVVGQTKLLTALAGGLHLLGQLDKLLDDLMSGDGAVVVGVQGLLELLGKQLALHQVALERES